MTEHETNQLLLISAFAALVERKERQIAELEKGMESRDVHIKELYARIDDALQKNIRPLRQADSRALRYEKAAQALYARCTELVGMMAAKSHRQKPDYDPIAHKIWNDAAVPEQAK